MPSRGRSFYFLLLVVACLMFAGQGTAIKYLGRHLGPLQITFVPFTLATLALLPLALRVRRTSGVRLGWADWRQFIIAGVAGQVVTQLGFVAGVTRSLASNGAVLSLLLPVISTLLAAIMLGERLTKLRVSALAIGLAGALLLSAGNLRDSSFLNMSYLVGNLLIVLAMTGSAFYNVYAKSLFEKFQQIEVLVFSYVAAAVTGLSATVVADPIQWSAFQSFTWQAWVALAYQALVAYSAAMLLFFAALKRLDVATASLSLYLLPVFGVVLAAVLLDERLSAAALAGAGIVLAATLLVVRYDTKST
ncbi:MAG: DMT family transporter [Acidobacteriales bacterium]|nr:DMT family transporter [Terriglobales bacterium]